MTPKRNTLPYLDFTCNGTGEYVAKINNVHKHRSQYTRVGCDKYATDDNYIKYVIARWYVVITSVRFYFWIIFGTESTKFHREPPNTVIFYRVGELEIKNEITLLVDSDTRGVDWFKIYVRVQLGNILKRIIKWRRARTLFRNTILKWNSLNIPL